MSLAEKDARRKWFKKQKEKQKKEAKREGSQKDYQRRTTREALEEAVERKDGKEANRLLRILIQLGGISSEDPLFKAANKLDW